MYFTGKIPFVSYRDENCLVYNGNTESGPGSRRGPYLPDLLPRSALANGESVACTGTFVYQPLTILTVRTGGNRVSLYVASTERRRHLQRSDSDSSGDTASVPPVPSLPAPDRISPVSGASAFDSAHQSGQAGHYTTAMSRCDTTLSRRRNSPYCMNFYGKPLCSGEGEAPRQTKRPSTPTASIAAESKVLRTSQMSQADRESDLSPY